MNTENLRQNSFFSDIALELGDVLDLNPAGITQESAWAHFKRKGIKASVDVIRRTLDTLTTRGDLVAGKTVKNETVWKRAPRAGVNIIVTNISPLTEALQHTSEQARAHFELSIKKALATTRRPIDAVDRTEATRERVNEMAIAASAIPEPDTSAAPAQVHATTPADLPEISAVIAPIDPPPPSATDKPIRHRSIQTSTGQRIEAEIIEHLAKDQATRKQLMDFTRASGTGVDNALKRLVAAGQVMRTPAGAWALTGQGTAFGGATPQLPPIAAPPRAMKRSLAKADTSDAADLEGCLQRFTRRLQPLERVGEKVAVLDQLITIVPAPIADVLTQVRGDVVRMAGA